MFSKSFKVVTHSSSCDFKPPFVGSSIEAPVLSSTGASSTERSTTLRVPVSGSASALRSKNVNGAGRPTCVGHGLRSLRSTSRRFAGSSVLKGKVADGKAWNCRQSSDFEDSFVPCTSPSQRIHFVHSMVRLSSSQDTHDMHGDMNSCGSVHGGGVHDNSFGMHVNSCGALGHRNSCNLDAAGVRGGTNPPSISTRLGVRCPAVEKLASPW